MDQVSVVSRDMLTENQLGQMRVSRIEAWERCYPLSGAGLINYQSSLDHWVQREESCVCKTFNLKITKHLYCETHFFTFLFVYLLK